jgi:MORN repeat variant
MKNVIIGLIVTITFYSCTDKGEWRVNYHPNGNVSERYFVNEDGHVEGVGLSFHRNGKLAEKKHFKNGLLDGTYESYYENGKLEKRGFLQEGVTIGDISFFSRTGALLEIATYNDSILEKAKTYHPNGNIKLMFSNSVVSPLKNTVVKFNWHGQVIEKESTYVKMKFQSPKKLSMTFVGTFDKYSDSMILYIKNDIMADVRTVFKLLPENYIRRVKIPFEQRGYFLLELRPSDFDVNGRLNIEVLAYARSPHADNPNLYYPPPEISYYVQLDRGEKPNKYNIRYIEK